MKTPLDIQTLVDTTLANLSPVTAEIMNFRKGAFSPLVTWTSEVKPAAAHKGVQLVKTTTACIRAGIDYANMKSVKDGIESGERGEVGPLPWGEWEVFGYTIQHKGQRYVRLTPAGNNKPTTVFQVDGKTVSRAEFAEYLTPSDKEKLLNPVPPACFCVKENSLLGIGELA